MEGSEPYEHLFISYNPLIIHAPHVTMKYEIFKMYFSHVSCRMNPIQQEENKQDSKDRTSIIYIRAECKDTRCSLYPSMLEFYSSFTNIYIKTCNI
jgi:hypothetical protein